MLNGWVRRCDVFYQTLMHGVHNNSWYKLVTVTCRCINLTIVEHHNDVVCPKTFRFFSE